MSWKTALLSLKVYVLLVSWACGAENPFKVIPTHRSNPFVVRENPFTVRVIEPPAVKPSPKVNPPKKPDSPDDANYPRRRLFRRR